MTRGFFSGCLLAAAALACGHGAATIQSPETASVDERIARITSAMTPMVLIVGEQTASVNLEERMRLLGVPGVSIAVINHGAVEWARGFGFADVRTRRPATEETLFQAASISKPFGALATLVLVDDGLVNLDAPVNDVLVSWKVPDNDLTERHPVTLRQLLTHTAGLGVHGFPGYGPGERVPSTADVLGGTGNTDPVQVVVEPGTVWSYSGGGYTVAQLVVEDVTGRDFAEFAAEKVLDPLGMDHSTFLQPLPEELRDRAATGYRRDGSAVEGRYRIHPELAAAGLWTTPSDLAKYLLAAQEGWRTGRHPVLSAGMLREMLTPGIGDVGLGSAFTGDGKRLFFAGSNEGFRCQMTAFLEGDQGAVVMTNSDTGLLLASELILTIAAEYGWPNPRPEYRTVIELSDSDWNALEGVYRGAGRELTVEAEDGRLRVSRSATGVGAPDVLEWRPESRATFFGTRFGNTIKVHWNDDGTVLGFELAGHLFEKVK